MINRLEKIKGHILAEKNVLERLSIFRMIFSILLTLQLLDSRETFHFTFLYDHLYHNSLPWYYGFYDYWLDFNILLLLLNFVGYGNKIIKILLAVSLIPYLYIWNSHLYQVTDAIWRHTVFQPVFLFMQIFAKTDAIIFGRMSFQPRQRSVPSQYDYFLISFLQIYVINMFFVSSISKAIVDGPFWFWDGKLLKLHTLMTAPDFGIAMVRSEPILKLMGIGAFIFEFGGYFIFKFNKKLYAMTGIIFHLFTWIVMDVNFILLWPLYIPIFFDLDWIAKWRNAHISTSESKV